MTDMTGGSLCGAVRYVIRGRPKLSVACHCRDCQYVSGGGPAYAMILMANNVTITKGTAKEHFTVSYVTRPAEFEKYTDLRRRYFGPPSPRSATVAVPQLAGPDFLVQVEAFAKVR